MTDPQVQYVSPEPAMAAVPVKSGSPASKLVRPLVAALVVAAVGFAGGYVVANATAKPAAVVTGNGGFGNGGFGAGASPGAGRQRGGVGGGASGTVSGVSADQMTVTTATGAQRLVLLTPTTTVTEVTSTTKSVADLANGTTVTVVGTANPDGSVTATQVIIGNAGLFGRGFGPGESPAPSGSP